MTYSAGVLDKTTTGLKNTVRLLIGDTDTNDEQLEDQEIEFALSENNNNTYYAAAWSARAIASKYSRQVTTEVSGALRAEYSDLSKQYYKLADTLEYKGKTSGATVDVIAGGIKVSRVNSVEQLTDRVKPSFRRDNFKNPPNYTNDDYNC